LYVISLVNAKKKRKRTLIHLAACVTRPKKEITGKNIDSYITD